MSNEKPKNVLGENLEICSLDTRTGFTRSGACETGKEDIGSHTVCAQVTREFLDFSRSRGNDLISPVPQVGFPGLRPGDRWCSPNTGVLAKRARAGRASSHRPANAG